MSPIKPIFKSIDSIGIVVKDIDETVKNYVDSFGIGPFNIYEYGPDNIDVNVMHPRLTTRSGGNNDRNSSYWAFGNDSFILPTVQLTYHFNGGSAMPFLHDSQIYVRGSNIAVISKNKAFTEVNPYGAPRTSSVVIGIITSF